MRFERQDEASGAPAPSPPCFLSSPPPLPAIALLKDQEPGAFIIRDSHSFRGAYGLAMKVSSPPPTIMQQNKKGNTVSLSWASGRGARRAQALGRCLVPLGAPSCCSDSSAGRVSGLAMVGGGRRMGRRDCWDSVVAFPGGVGRVMASPSQVLAVLAVRRFLPSEPCTWER